jgi:hypothetical protein
MPVIAYRRDERVAPERLLDDDRHPVADGVPGTDDAEKLV